MTMRSKLAILFTSNMEKRMCFSFFQISVSILCILCGIFFFLRGLRWYLCKNISFNVYTFLKLYFKQDAP